MKEYQKIFIMCLFVAILYAYFILINQWNFQQISDFLNYYRQALSYKYYKELDVKFLFFQPPGHPVMMSLWMQLLRNDAEKYLQWINVFEYILVIGIVFLSTKKVPFKFRIISIISLTICVSYVSLLGFLCAEFNFLLFFVIANFLLIKLVTHQVMKRSKKRLVIFSIGLSFGIAQFIRPLSLYYFLFFVIGILIIKYFFKEKKYDLPANRHLLAAFGVSVITTLCLYKSTLGYWRYQPPQNGLMSMFIGLNVKSEGRYNAEDAQQFEKIGNDYQWQEDPLRQVLKEQVESRFKNGLAYNLTHFPQRAIHLLVPYFTSYWFFAKGLPPNKTWIIIMKIIFVISTVWCLLAQGINFWYFIKLIAEGVTSRIEIFIFCSLLSIYLYLIIHITILEIQPRYSAHIMFMNLWILPFGLSKIFSKNSCELPS